MSPFLKKILTMATVLIIGYIIGCIFTGNFIMTSWPQDARTWYGGVMLVLAYYILFDDD